MLLKSEGAFELRIHEIDVPPTEFLEVGTGVHTNSNLQLCSDRAPAAVRVYERLTYRSFEARGDERTAIEELALTRLRTVAALASALVADGGEVSGIIWWRLRPRFHRGIATMRLATSPPLSSRTWFALGAASLSLRHEATVSQYG